MDILKTAIILSDTDLEIIITSLEVNLDGLESRRESNELSTEDIQFLDDGWELLADLRGELENRSEDKIAA